VCNRLDTPNNPLPHDNYLTEALEIAHQLQEREPRFTLELNQQLVQGKPNRVLRARYDEQPIILKYYGDHWNVPGPERKNSELFYLEHCASTGVVPHIVRGDLERLLLMEEIPGITLKVFYEQHSGHKDWALLVQKLSFEIGQAYARLAALPLTDELRCAFEKQFGSGQNLETTVENLLSQAERLCDTVETCFKVERDTISFIRSKLPLILRQPRLLHKYDLNQTNTIIYRGHFQAFIDFEQCYICTEFMLLGGVLDAVDFLDWSALKLGYEAAAGKRLSTSDLEVIVAMAHYKNWLRVIGNWENGLFHAKRVEKLKARFHRAGSYLERV